MYHDQRIKERQETFQKSNSNIVVAREEYKLKLRKNKIDEFLLKRREKYMERTSKSTLEIDPIQLNLPEEVINRTFTKFDDFVFFVENLLKSTNLNEVKFGVYSLRRQLSLECYPPIMEIVNAGFMEKLLGVLDTHFSDNSLVYEILWCFINISAGRVQEEILNFFSTPRALRLFQNILKSQEWEVLYHFFWLLSHLSIEGSSCKEALINSGIFENVITLLETNELPENILRHGIWVIASFAKTRQPPTPYKLVERALKILLVYSTFDDVELMNDCVWGVCNFLDLGHANTLKMVIESGLIPRLFTTDFSKSGLLSAPLRIVGNMLTGDDTITNHMIKLGCVAFNEQFLNHNSKLARREALWGISNILAGTLDQIKFVADSNIIPKISELCRDPELIVAQEAVVCLSNALAGSDLQTSLKIIQQGAMDALLEVIKNRTDHHILLVALEGIRHIFLHGRQVKLVSGMNPFLGKFRANGGIEALERLQNHNNNEVYNTVITLLEHFFTTEDVLN